MSAESALPITDGLAIPRHELTFRATRAGGPGGQHVNTSATRVELVWNLETSAAVSDEQRQRLRDKLATRLDANGNVRLVASAHRSQLRNRGDAERRLAELVRRALAPAKPRRKTRPPRSAVDARLRVKRHTSERKRQRSRKDFD